MYTIQLIARNNNSPQNLLHKLNRQIQQQQQQQQQKAEQTKERNKNKTWTTFTYYSPKIRKITNLFKHTNVGNILPEHKHRTTAHKAKNRQQDSRTGQERNLRTYM